MQAQEREKKPPAGGPAMEMAKPAPEMANGRLVELVNELGVRRGRVYEQARSEHERRETTPRAQGPSTHRAAVPRQPAPLCVLLVQGCSSSPRNDRGSSRCGFRGL